LHTSAIIVTPNGLFRLLSGLANSTLNASNAI
jgi:hypothetical protein